MSTPIRSAGGLIRGLSLGELSPRSPEVALTPFDFDTKKVATHGTLKRLKLVKSPTDTQLFVPNQVPAMLDPGTNGNYFVFIMRVYHGFWVNLTIQS